MAGTQIIQEGDYSPFGLGQYSIYADHVTGFDAALGNVLTATEKAALQTLYANLVTAGMWAKIDALYPFVGGTANSHKFNFKNYADSDAAYRLVFYNDAPAAHTAKGYLGASASSRYADTRYFYTGDLTNCYVGFHNTVGEVNDSAQRAIIGGSAQSPLSTRVLLARNWAGLTEGELAKTTGGLITSSTLARDKTGPLAVKNDNGTVKLWDDETLVGTGSAAIPITGGNVPLYLFGYKNQSSAINYFSDAGLGTATIAKFFTDAEAVNMNKFMKAFNVALGR